MPIVAHRIGRVRGISLVFLFGIVNYADQNVIVLSCLGDFYFEFRTLFLMDGIIEDELGPRGASNVLNFPSFNFEATPVKLWQTQAQVT